MTRSSKQVMDVSRLCWREPFQVYGVKTYTLSTNHMSWAGAYAGSLSDIAQDFGTPVQGTSLQFKCGNDTITAFDYGLLYSIFIAINTSAVSSSLQFDEMETSSSKINCLWIGDSAVIYSVEHNLILHLDSFSLESVMNGNKASIDNFCSKEFFTVELEKNSKIFISKDDEHFLCSFNLSDFVKNLYFETDDEDDIEIFGEGFDADSPLGELVASSISTVDIMSTAEKYKNMTDVSSVVRRTDLVFKADKPYSSLNNFFGSVCYQDGNIFIPVNYMNGLLVYSQLFKGDLPDTLHTSTPGSFSGYFDIKDAFESIMRFAQSIANRPSSILICDIEERFKKMELLRVPVESTFGKLVIPESNLLQALSSGIVDTISPIIPIGIIETQLLAYTGDDIETMENKEEFFYCV